MSTSISDTFSNEEWNYIRSGASFSPEKECLIQAGFSDLEANIRRIDQEISGLSSERKEATELLLKRRTLLAPIRRLPPEVLENIFIHCLPSWNVVQICFQPPRSLQDPLSYAFPPLMLAQVCCRWREVAIGSPRLWTLLHINRNDEVPDRIIKLCLARSGQLPLRISIGYITPAVEDILLCLTHRFQKLRLDMAESYYLLHKFQPLPILQELVFIRSLDNSYKKMDSNVLEAPVLERMNIRNFSPQCLNNVPRSQLTHLTLTDPWICTATLDLLQSCSRLQHLALFNIYFKWGLSVPVQQAFVLSELRSLEIVLEWSSGHDYIVNFLEHFIVPNLRRLIFRNFMTYFKHVCFSLVSRSACPLEHLEVEIIGGSEVITEGEQVELVKTLPFLRTLKLGCTHYPFTISLIPEVAELLAARINPAGN